jgi:hypothetical protein
MKDVQSQRTVAPIWVLVVLMATISVTGCISNSSNVSVSPDEAATVLRPGDAVEITRKDETVVHLKVKKIDDTEVYGSNQMSMFGRIKETIPLSDVASINLYKKGEGYDTDQTIEAWSYLLILWPFFVF